MLVKDIMSKDVIMARPSDTLSSLVRKFIKHNFHTLPVVERKDGLETIVGIVNYEDMMKVFVPHNPALAELLSSTHLYLAEEEDVLAATLPPGTGDAVKVGDIMDRKFVTVDREATLSQARLLMKQHNTERLPVTKDGALAGFITLFDIIVAVFREKGVIG